MGAEVPEAGLAQGGEAVVLDVVPIEVGEELFKPLVHDLVVLPAMTKFRQEDRPALAGLVAERREDVGGEVPFDRFSVALIELTRPVVGGPLRAHVITSPET